MLLCYRVGPPTKSLVFEKAGHSKWMMLLGSGHSPLATAESFLQTASLMWLGSSGTSLVASVGHGWGEMGRIY